MTRSCSGISQHGSIERRCSNLNFEDRQTNTMDPVATSPSQNRNTSQTWVMSVNLM